MTVAPSAAAAIETPMPIVWSESPTLQSNIDAMTGMRSRLASSGMAGYELVQASSVRSVHPPSRAASTAAATSPIEAVPTEMIIGLPVCATSVMRGVSTISSDAIL